MVLFEHDNSNSKAGDNSKSGGKAIGRFSLVSMKNCSKLKPFVDKCEVQGLPLDFEKVTVYSNASKHSQTFFCVHHADEVLLLTADTAASAPKLDCKVLFPRDFSMTALSDPGKPFKASLADFDLSTFRAVQTPASGLLVSMLRRDSSELNFFLVDPSATANRISVPHDPIYCFNEGDSEGGQKKLLELGRTMMVDAKIVFLDEVGAGVNRTLLNTIGDAIIRLNKERGYTFCVIEHDMDFIGRLCNPVICMAEGKVLAEGTVDEVKNNERVIEAYLGTGLKNKVKEGAMHG